MKKILVLLFVVGVDGVSASSVVTLTESFRAASSKSELIQQGNERVVQADARESQLIGGIFPNLSFNLSHQIQPLPSDPIAAQFSPQHQTTANFSITQPLFRGLREFNGLKQLKHLRASEMAGNEWTRSRLYQEVAAAYLQVLSFEQDLVNLKDQSALYEKRVGELNSRANRGESNRSDVIAAQSTQASLAAEIRLIEGQLEIARENFNFLTGLDRTSRLEDPNLTEKNALRPLDTYLEYVDKRADVRAAFEKLEASRKALDVAQGYHWPSLDATGNYYLKRPGFLSDLKWDIGLRLTLPLFEGGTTVGRVREATSKQKEADLEWNRTRRAAQQEIRSLYERVKARLEHLANLKRSADLSRQNTVLMQQDYRRGLARNIDVQLALTEHRIAQRNFDQSHFSSQLEMIQLQTATSDAPVLEKETQE